MCWCFGFGFHHLSTFQVQQHLLCHVDGSDVRLVKIDPKEANKLKSLPAQRRRGATLRSFAQTITQLNSAVLYDRPKIGRNENDKTERKGTKQ